MISPEEVGSVIGQGIPNVLKLSTYARYNTELSREGLDALGLNTSIRARPANGFCRPYRLNAKG